MSDCSTEAMKPKEKSEVCGFPEIKILRLLRPQGEPDVIECDGRRYVPEQRYQQLEQVALWMLDTMADFCAPAYSEEAKERLESLGVNVDE